MSTRAVLPSLTILACAMLFATPSQAKKQEAPAATSASLPTWSCDYDFEVTLTQGPDAGWQTKGRLTLLTQDDHSFAGRLVPTGGGGNIRVTGETTTTAAGASITLNMDLNDGRRVVGVGPLPTPIHGCASGQKLEGVAVGPQLAADFQLAGSDAGHWLATTYTAATLTVTPLDLMAVSLDLAPTGSDTASATIELEPGVITRRDCMACGGTVKSTSKGDACVYDDKDSGVSTCINGARRGAQKATLKE